MANEIDRINYTDLVLESSPTVANETAIEYGGSKIQVKTHLSLTEMMLFVTDVVNDCFIGEDSVYCPEIKSFTIERHIIEFYTNLELPNDAMELYDFCVCNRELVDTIADKVEPHQFSNILSAIDEKIDLINNSRVSEVTKQINELYGMIDNIGSQVGGIFEGINQDDIKNILKVLPNTQIDEEILAKNIVAQEA